MFLPELMQDEHVYSGLIRARYLSGQMYINERRFFELNELPYHWPRSQVPLCQNLRVLIEHYSNCVLERYQLRLNHTPFAPWLLSLPTELRAEEFVGSGLKNNLEENPFTIDRKWKFCTSCAEEEHEQHGFSYWHSSHQLLGVRQCFNHKKSLHTHDRLRYLGYSLPHQWGNEGEALSLSEWQVEWQVFIEQITCLIKKKPNVAQSLIQEVKFQLGVNDVVKRSDKPKFEELSQLMNDSLGNEVLSGLFTSYARDHSKKTNIIWALLSGFTKTQGIHHPIYWLSILFWLRDELPILRGSFERTANNETRNRIQLGRQVSL